MDIQRTTFRLAALASLTNALTLNDYSFLTDDYQNQQQCDALVDSVEFHYEFNQDACKCFFCFDVAYDPNCHGSTPFFNPLHLPGHANDLCISLSAYQALFVHDLGNDCLPNTADDPHEESDPEIDHESNPSSCPSGTTFNQSACACFVDDQCDINCSNSFPQSPFQNPLEICECINQVSINEIYEHGLTTTCQAPPDEDDDEGDDDEDGDEDEGEFGIECGHYEELNTEMCKCVSTRACDNHCYPPLIKDPVTGCECITQEEYSDLFDHDLDEFCKPTDDQDDCDCGDGSSNCCGKTTNIYNFYGPTNVYVTKDCCDGDDDCFIVEEEEEGPVCDPWEGYNTDCAENPFLTKLEDFSLPHADGQVYSCGSSYGNAYFEYIIQRANWVNAVDSQCIEIQELADNLVSEDVSLFDNEDFLHWIQEASNPYGSPVKPAIENNNPLPDAIKELFLTSGMACPFVTIGDLQNAVEALYDYRVAFQLETDIAVVEYTVDASTCTSVTQAAIQAYVDQINAGREAQAQTTEVWRIVAFINDYIECGESPCN